MENLSSYVFDNSRTLSIWRDVHLIISNILYVYSI